jgi:hypothetical protein
MGKKWHKGPLFSLITHWKIGIRKKASVNYSVSMVKNIELKSSMIRQAQPA